MNTEPTEPNLTPEPPQPQAPPPPPETTAEPPVPAPEEAEDDAPLLAAEEAEALNASWRESVDEALKSRPDLLEMESPLSKEVLQTLQDHGYLMLVPGGFSKAVELAELRLVKAAHDRLQTEHAATRAELDRITRLGSLTASGPQSRPNQKAVHEMSADEADEYLADLAMEADRSRN
jgi:hypothetical protein